MIYYDYDYDYDDGASPSCHCPSWIAYGHDLLSSGIATVSDDVSLLLSLSHHPKDHVDDDDGDGGADRYGARMRDIVLRRRDEQVVVPLVLYPPLFDVADAWRRGTISSIDNRHRRNNTPIDNSIGIGITPGLISTYLGALTDRQSVEISTELVCLTEPR